MCGCCQIPFVEEPTESFIRAASLRVNQWLFTPGQFISRAGDLAVELYYIKYGEVWTAPPTRRRRARCRPLLHVARSSVVCVLGSRVNCAKTAEPIEMLFGGRTRVIPCFGRRVCLSV